MATQIYACLCGEWVNLTDDADCKMGKYKTPPNIWWEESAHIYSPNKKSEENTLYQQDHIHINYKNADYRIHPVFIQVKYS
ncbi:hypothetical protein QF033_000607 [Bacillus pumilus]|uniref:hypothetical protein n=1 Tax=Bacillus TaxID=1386 RepID=UPI002788276B|nr:hypothetical protein [Bacillus pumilus]MDQ0816029.1 hypothetical protein [Bacillus pumilus]